MSDEEDEKSVSKKKSSRSVQPKPAQNYQMSTTLSPENVLVVLNLLRQDTGEWVLEKSVTQGLPNDNQNQNAPAECTKFNEVNDVLEKLQAHVDSVNCEIKNAKETIEEQKKLCRNASPSRRQNCGGGGGGGYSNMSRNCGHQSSSCNDNSFVSQIFEMFSILWNGDADMCTCSGGNNDGSNTLTDEQLAAMNYALENGENTASSSRNQRCKPKAKTADGGQSMKENQSVGPDAPGKTTSAKIEAEDEEDDE